MTQRRLFLAFWPDERLCRTLELACNRLFPLAGRPVAVTGLHVTAAFLGTVNDTRLAALMALCGPVTAAGTRG